MFFLCLFIFFFPRERRSAITHFGDFLLICEYVRARTLDLFVEIDGSPKRLRRQSDWTGAETLTSTFSMEPSSNLTTEVSANESGKESGSTSVAVIVVITILAVALVIGVAVFVFLRIRRRRMADYEKKTQIQMSSTSNAGVYVDLTSGPATDKEKLPDSPETEHLNREDD